jgi:hypothetical protein
LAGLLLLRPLGRQVVGDGDLALVAPFSGVAPLLGGLSAPDNLACRIIGLGGGRDLVEVDLGRDLGVDPARAHATLEKLDDLGLQPLFERNPVFLRVAGSEAARARALGQ